jgi:hypothetical protein
LAHLAEVNQRLAGADTRVASATLIFTSCIRTLARMYRHKDNLFLRSTEFLRATEMIKRYRTLCVVLLASLHLGGCTVAHDVVWQLDSLQNIGGHAVTVVGEPEIVDAAIGQAIEFDGIDDGLFLDVHPLAGFDTFTVEVIFKPYSGGRAEQRFFHMQDRSSEHRVMFETRLTGDGRWFLDTFIYTGGQKVTLFAEDQTHDLDTWYHVAIVVDDDSFAHYVNGQKELSAAIDYEAQQGGRSSLGVRLNRVDWFKGAIRTVRFTPQALSPDEFLSVTD